MYEKILGLAMLGISVFMSLLWLKSGRRNGTEGNNSGTGSIEQRAEAEVDGTKSDNRTAAEQNRELRENNDRAEELIQRAKEILNI